MDANGNRKIRRFRDHFIRIPLRGATVIRGRTKFLFRGDDPAVQGSSRSPRRSGTLPALRHELSDGRRTGLAELWPQYAALAGIAGGVLALATHRFARSVS